MSDHPPLKFAAIGLDHRHIYHQVGRLLGLGAACKGYYARDTAVALEGFIRRFPDLPRVQDVRALLEDPEIQLIVSEGWRHSGLGTAMAPVIFAAARDLGVAKVIVEVTEQQAGGRAIFERLGFRVEGILSDHVSDRHGNRHNLLILAYHVS